MSVVELVAEQPQEQITFDVFWEIYPRRDAKKDARKAWEQVSKRDYVAILSALVWQRKLWADRESRYILLPGSYLRGERWTDEAPRDLMVSSSSHVEFVPSVPAERGVMPESVKALLAQIRGKK